MDIMKLNDLAMIQWYMCSWNAELQDWIAWASILIIAFCWPQQNI